VQLEPFSTLHALPHAIGVSTCFHALHALGDRFTRRQHPTMRQQAWMLNQHVISRATVHLTRHTCVNLALLPIRFKPVHGFFRPVQPRSGLSEPVQPGSVWLQRTLSCFKPLQALFSLVQPGSWGFSPYLTGSSWFQGPTHLSWPNQFAFGSTTCRLGPFCTMRCASLHTQRHVVWSLLHLHYTEPLEKLTATDRTQRFL
jgi:hypothetical protein